MSLRETALNLGVKRQDTCKLFYGTYPYSLTTKVPLHLIEERQEATDKFWKSLQARRVAKVVGFAATQKSTSAIRTAFNEKVKDHIWDIAQANADILGEEWDYTYNAKTITFYVLREQTVEQLLKNNPSLFVRFNDPHNEKSAAFLSRGDPKVLVRQCLFEGEFEYRIAFKPAPGFDYDNLDERVNRLYFTKKSYSYGMKSRTLYLNGDDDLFLARMGLEEEIEKITKCVQVSEL